MRDSARVAAYTAAIASLLAAIAAPLALAQADADTAAAKEERIAVVLGGGGALGLAHVGVLSVLEEAGIDADIVVGTSMGAVIGSLYAAGYSGREIEEIALGLDWGKIFRDSAPRRQLVFRRKEELRVFPSGLRVGLSRDGLKLPRGVISGRRLRETIASLLSARTLAADFDALERRFRAVATDIETFEPVVLKEGDLAAAVFASMAVPAFIPPQVIDGRTLIDGGVASNVPIDVARALGADRLIVVNLSVAPASAEEIDSVVDVIGQLTTFLTLQNVRRELPNLEDGDLLLEPLFEGYSPTDFDKGAELIAIGREAAQAQLAALQALAAPPRRPQSPLAAKPPELTAAPTIETIRIENATQYPTRFIEGAVEQALGDPLDYATLSKNIDTLYGTDEFASIGFSVEADATTSANDAALVLDLQPKAIGNTYLTFGVETTTDFRNEAVFNFLSGLLIRNLTPAGGELRAAVQIGDDPSLAMEIFQPTDVNHKWFVSGTALVQRDLLLANDGNGDAFGEFRQDIVDLSLSTGRTIRRTIELRTGISQQWGELSNVAALGDVLPIDFSGRSLFGLLTVDTLDQQFFPRRGVFGQFAYDHPISGDDAFVLQQFAGSLAFAQPLFGGTLAPSWEWAFSLDETDLDFTEIEEGIAFPGFQTLGGPFRLSGLGEGELAGRHKVLMSLAYYRPLGEAPLFGEPLYVGASVEAGNTFQRTNEIAFDSLRYGGSVFVGARTPLGVFQLGAGITGDNAAVFLLINPGFLSGF
ncbi:MAG: patatin-like phospholipase family protein [Pseudomonadota bacterium]